MVILPARLSFGVISCRRGGCAQHPDVDIVLRRADLSAARSALEQAGVDICLDGCNVKTRNAVHLVFAGEKVRGDYLEPVPDVLKSDKTETFRLLSPDAIVRMKLTSFRDKDRVQLRDLMDVGLVDEEWRDRVPRQLRQRLQQLRDSPEG